MILTTVQRERIQTIIDTLEAGSAGKHIDDTSIEQLARVFGAECGFECGCPGTFQEGMRDTPFSTLLKVILCIG